MWRNLRGVACVLLSAACTSDVELGVNFAHDAGQGATQDGGRTPGESDGAAQVPYCQAQTGLQTGANMEVCPGQLAQSTFAYALCTCSDTHWQALTTDSFDSRENTLTVSSKGGSVGSNTAFSSIGPISIGGSLHNADTTQLLGGGEVHEDLVAGADVSSQGSLDIAGNARVNGALRSTGSTITVHGNLVQPAGQSNQGLVVQGTTTNAAVSAALPCPCDKIDVAAYVSAAQKNNDDVALAWPSDKLDGVFGAQEYDLPCGRIYLTQVRSSGGITLNVTGRTALFIAGDLGVTGTLHINVKDPGELDLFVQGALQVIGDLVVSAKHAASVRIYALGKGSAGLGEKQFNGLLYAPQTSVSGMPLEVSGSLVVSDVSATQVTAHFDRSVLEAASACP